MKDLEQIPISERQHFQYCSTCGHYYDQRDIEAVLYHAQAQCALDGNAEEVSGRM